MLPQIAMLQRLTSICHADDRLVAAMQYGSWTRGEGDEFSDLDVALYFKDDALAGIDSAAWIAQIAPVELYFINPFGNHTAIFDNLVRGEFHFDPASAIPKIESWRGNVWFPTLADTLILDRTGELTRYLQPYIGLPPRQDTPEQVQAVCYNFINWTLFGSNVLARGELARAQEILVVAHDDLLRMARLLGGATAHWITPTKGLERDVSSAAYARYQSCTAPTEAPALRRAYRNAWTWGREMMAVLATRYPIALPSSLLEKIEGRSQLKNFMIE